MTFCEVNIEEILYDLKVSGPEVTLNLIQAIIQQRDDDLNASILATLIEEMEYDEDIPALFG
tara:strand:+ start:1406 stop:1591 length:186 start_codon:yes stop_codon:yes gene_type:complete